MNPETTIVIFEFSKEEILRKDFSRFLSKFAPENLPSGSALRELMDSVFFTVGGFDHDPREICHIPEIRAFYQGLTKEWPYFAFFANLDTDNFVAVFLCLLGTLTTAQHDNHAKMVSEGDVSEFKENLQRMIKPAVQLFERAGMTEAESEARFDRFISYLTEKRS